MIKKILFISFALNTTVAIADTAPKNTDLTSKKALIHIKNQNQKEFYYTRSELEEHPEFTGTLLQIAISNNNNDLIKKLLPTYESANNTDNLLINYAKSLLAKSQGNYSAVAEHLKKIMVKNPELDQIRLELAIALFYDQQNVNAKNQFNKLKSSKKVTGKLKQVIDSYLEAIEKRSEWDFNASFSYIQDSNINNVSDSEYVGSWKKPKSHLPQSAHGISYDVGISKDFNIKDKHYIAFENYLNGEKYWDNKDYNDLTNRTYLGYRYKSANTTVSILPFYKYNWAASSDYNNYSTGVKAHIYQRIDPHFSYSLSGEYSKNHFPKDDDFNGHNAMLSSTLYWQRSPKQNFYFGTAANRKKTNVKRFNSISNSVHTGWVQEWPKGISSRLGLGYSKTTYGAMAKYGGLVPLGKTRKDESYTADITIWKRDWQILGITPKLNMHMKKQVSNLPDVYSYDKINANILFEKSF